VLKERKLSDQLVVIAHEITPHNRNAHRDRLIDAIITWNISHMVRITLRVLRAKSNSIDIDNSQAQMRIEIVLKENLT